MRSPAFRRVAIGLVPLLVAGLIAAGLSLDRSEGGAPVDRVFATEGIRTADRNVYCYAQWTKDWWKAPKKPSRFITALQCWVFSTAGGPYGHPIQWLLKPTRPAVSARTHDRPLTARLLPPRRLWQGGPFRCRSTKSSLHCWSVLSKRGFTLGRDRQVTF
ncbi:MAG: hypothetical protein ABR521_01520 [Gaiellaceae bacterium]